MILEINGKEYNSMTGEDKCGNFYVAISDINNNKILAIESFNKKDNKTVDLKGCVNWLQSARKSTIDKVVRGEIK